MRNLKRTQPLLRLFALINHYIMLLQIAQLEWDTSQSENPMGLAAISINQSILDERQFQVRQKSLDRGVIQVDEKGEEEEGGELYRITSAISCIS